MPTKPNLMTVLTDKVFVDYLASWIHKLPDGVSAKVGGVILTLTYGAWTTLAFWKPEFIDPKTADIIIDIGQTLGWAAVGIEGVNRVSCATPADENTEGKLLSTTAKATAPMQPMKPVND